MIKLVCVTPGCEANPFICAEAHCLCEGPHNQCLKLGFPAFQELLQRSPALSTSMREADKKIKSLMSFLKSRLDNLQHAIEQQLGNVVCQSYQYEPLRRKLASGQPLTRP